MESAQDLLSPKVLANELSRSDALKEHLRVGDKVRVRDLASKKWRVGTVTSVSPCAVRPSGWTVGFEWDLVDLLPSAGSGFSNGTHVRIAAAGMIEGPLRHGDVGVVQEIKKAFTSS